MAHKHEHFLRRYRTWYSKLLHLYPKPYRERFGEGMEQTFNDLLREHAENGNKPFGYALQMCFETSAGIIKENIMYTTMHNKNIIRILLGTAFILMIPLVAMQFTNEVNWDLTDFIIMGTLMISIGLAYEFTASKVKDSRRRLILAMAFLGAFLFIWAELAVGILNIPGISGS